MKRITKKLLERYDSSHNTSVVRELEMAVDALNVGAYTAQYWRDVELFGLKEANMYLDSVLKNREINSLPFNSHAHQLVLKLSTEIIEKVNFWLNSGH